MATTPPSRRCFLHLSAAGAAALLAGCDPDEVLADITDWEVPSTDDLELGEVQFGWDGDGNLYEIRPSAHTVTRLKADGSDDWTIGGVADVEAGG